jgi:hypothetical protein
VWSQFVPDQAQSAPVLIESADWLKDLFVALPGQAWSIELMCQDPHFAPPALLDETATLRQALNDSDAEAAARATHTAKGLAGSACALAALPLAKAMELAARQGELDTVREQLPFWDNALRELADAVRQWVAEQPEG